MTGTSSTAVRKLFPQDDASVDIDHYVADANLLVEEVLGASSLSEERQEIIARYLAAHLYVLGQQEGGVFEEKIGESTEKRGSTFTLGQGLKLTRWGQMVLALDTSGGFSGLDAANKSAQFRLV